MPKFFKRYFCCTVVLLILICMVYYRFYGRFQLDRIVVSSDEFIAVAYVLEDDDDNNRHLHNENHLLNITNFHYRLQPTNDSCKNSAQDILGLNKTSFKKFGSLCNFSFYCSNIGCDFVCWT